MTRQHFDDDKAGRGPGGDDLPQTRGAKVGAPEETEEAYTSTPAARGLGAGNPAGGPAKVVEHGRGTTPPEAEPAERPLRAPEELNATPPHGDVMPTEDE